jgi:hypothetical protein
MPTQRNSDGRFGSGHSGFKPKGAVAKKDHQRQERLDRMLDKLEETVEQSIPLLKPKEAMGLYLELLKLPLPKLARKPFQPDPPTGPPSKITFKIIPPGTPDN